MPHVLRNIKTAHVKLSYHFFLTYRRTFTSLPGRAAMLSFAASGRATNESNTKQSSLNLFPNIQLLNASWFELKIEDLCKVFVL